MPVKSRTISPAAPLLAEASLATLEAVAALFEHVPETAFFVKDREGRYLAVNRSLADRCGAAIPEALLGRHVREVFPRDLADRYARQDEAVMRTGRAIVDRLELHWYSNRRAGWCLTTKLPLRGADGSTEGLIGISRDLPDLRLGDAVPAALQSALEYLDAHFAEPLTPSDLAERSGLSAVRFARVVKRVFRITPSQLIAQTRLHAASRLLSETDTSVSDVAHACGFYDHSAFTRAFRAATGLTPRDFRMRSSARKW